MCRVGGYTQGMENLPIWLGIGLLLAGAAAVWLLVERSRLAAVAATAAAERDAAVAAREQAETAAAGLRALLTETESRLGAAEKQLSTLAERLRAETDGRVADVRQADARQEQALEVERKLSDAKLEAAQEARAAAEKLVREAQAVMREAFGTLSADALKANNEQFLSLAQQKLAGTLTEGAAAVKQQRDAVDTIVKPLSEKLAETNRQLVSLETLTQGMGKSNADLRTETERLVRALQAPNVRGSYGEVQLKRVAEIAGMRAYCDFAEQDSTRDADGRALRPDMVVRLPNQREIVVDAKANIQPYLDALEAHAEPERQKECMERFAAGIERQVRALGGKRYWAQYDGAPNFVVMFVPGDQFVDAALSLRPGLIETAAASNVVLASPSTLIGLLRAVAVAFKEQSVAENAMALLRLAKELHERMVVAVGHVEAVGRAIAQAGKHYDSFVGSYDKRLLPHLRRMEELEVASDKALPDVEPLNITVRSLPAPSERAGAGGAA